MKMFLLLLFLNVMSVESTPSWGFNNIRKSWHISDSDLKRFTLDPVSSRIVTNLCDGRVASTVMFRVEPPTNLMESFDRDREHDDLTEAKSCLVVNETSSQFCDICTSNYCQWDISLPCRFKPQQSRWSTTLELYVTIENGLLSECSTICLDIGYSLGQVTSANVILTIINFSIYALTTVICD
uniref:Uncharacterized protein n=1 Tax=Biomphalaria glabrata TaxID=6526 RepID=A0A2C9M5I4_BIOGL